MNKETRDLTTYRMEKARRTLTDAILYSDKAAHESTVNRIYYALFYAVSSLLLCKGLASSKHSGVRSLFNREFVKTGLVEERWGELLSEMFDKRQKGDYADYVSFEENEIQNWLSEADECLKSLDILLAEFLLE